MPVLYLLPSLMFLTSLVLHVNAGKAPVMIDDSDFSVIYQPSVSGVWTAHLDPGRAVGGTWHEATNDGIGITPAVSLSFLGSSLDVFCILRPNANATSSANRTSVAFTLDGSPAGQYTSSYELSGNDTLLYNTSIYSVQDLPFTNHTFTMTLDPQSTLLFDYALVGSPDDSVSTDFGKPSYSSGVVAGAVIGGSLAGLALGVCFMLLLSRRRRCRQPDNEFFKPDIDLVDETPRHPTEIQPYILPVLTASYPSPALPPPPPPPPQETDHLQVPINRMSFGMAMAIAHGDPQRRSRTPSPDSRLHTPSPPPAYSVRRLRI